MRSIPIWILPQSTIIKALKTGETTLNHRNILTTVEGDSFEVIDDTFPIRENGKIIGAVCITFSPLRKQAMKAPEHKHCAGQDPKAAFYGSGYNRPQRIHQHIAPADTQVAQTASSLLIYGDTGTGKEMVAQSVHSGSNRKNRPFLTQNCAAIPSSLLESIFFGTVKGSYTGAENHAGLFETADGGTVFLDEINSMDIGLQAKLLRVLEEKR